MLFVFVNERLACEIGETRWIICEDPETFKNIGWDTETQVMVTRPNEFSKLSKKIMKGSIDPLSIPTTTCVAKVLKFSGKWPISLRKLRTSSLQEMIPVEID